MQISRQGTTLLQLYLLSTYCIVVLTVPCSCKNASCSSVFINVLLYYGIVCFVLECDLYLCKYLSNQFLHEIKKNYQGGAKIHALHTKHEI